MSSTLPVPDDGPIDLKHLRQSTLGDAQLEREVLGMFAQQAARLIGLLASVPPEAAALAHTLSGSARAIGAFRVAETARAVELAIRDGHAPAQTLSLALTELSRAVTDARAAIETMLQPS